MNGGIHDAVNLAARLAAVWRGEAPDAELDRFDKQRRLVTLETIQKTHDPEQEEPGIARATNSATACARSPPIRRAPATI